MEHSKIEKKSDESLISRGEKIDMWEDILNQLTKLSKEQLIYIIEQYRNVTRRMSDTLARESKGYNSSKACDDIRDCLQDCDFIRNHELAAYVDMKLGKISGEEYRDIVLWKENV